jgi:hypothetical protein
MNPPSSKKTLSSITRLGGEEIKNAPRTRSLSASLNKASANFNERLMTFNLMEQLNHLCRSVQRHRGFSMGLLGGNQSFANGFYVLQEQMARRIQLMTAFAKKSPDLLNHTDIERLHYAWNTIHDNWQGDSVLENFEFHSHFVEQLLLLLARLGDRVRIPYLSQISSTVSTQDESNFVNKGSSYEELLYFSSVQLPKFIEVLGKIRALSVHIAATGYSEADYDRKLSYLLQCVIQEKDTIFELTNRLQHSLVDQLPTLLTIKTYEYKLDFLLEKITNEVVEQSVVSTSEEEIFRMVSDIIDIYWRVVDNSLDLLLHRQKEDLEYWLQNG